jgi:tRNA(adenine34) deaminase
MSPPPDPATCDALIAEALILAREAGEAGEVPVGAVVAFAGTVIARARNRVEESADPTAHAEVLAIRAAAAALGQRRLTGATLAVTLEPCAMCAGAIVLARLSTVVFGASDPKAGAMGTLYEIGLDRRLNHAVEVVPGVRARECGVLLSDFFRSRRDG